MEHPKCWSVCLIRWTLLEKSHNNLDPLQAYNLGLYSYNGGVLLGVSKGTSLYMWSLMLGYGLFSFLRWMEENFRLLTQNTPKLVPWPPETWVHGKLCTLVWSTHRYYQLVIKLFGNIICGLELWEHWSNWSWAKWAIMTGRLVVIVFPLKKVPGLVNVMKTEYVLFELLVTKLMKPIQGRIPFIFLPVNKIALAMRCVSNWISKVWHMFRHPISLWSMYTNVLVPTSVYLWSLYIELLIWVLTKCMTLKRLFAQEFTIFLQSRNIPKIKNAFLDACKDGDKSTMRRLLAKYESQVDVNVMQTKEGNTALHLACRGGHLVIVESLLDLREKVCNINIENNLCETPVIVAAEMGHVSIVKRLLRNKSLRLNYEYGKKAVIAAIKNDHYEVAQLIMLELEKRSIDTDIPNAKSLLSYLNKYTSWANKAKCTTTEYEVQKISMHLSNYRKSIQEIVSPPKQSESEPEGGKPMGEIVEELKECLECTICCETFEDMKVYACTRDHWICARCLPHNDRCPSCREDFNTHPPRRRVTYEKFLILASKLLCQLESASDTET